MLSQPYLRNQKRNKWNEAKKQRNHGIGHLYTANECEYPRQESQKYLSREIQIQTFRFDQNISSLLKYEICKIMKVSWSVWHKYIWHRDLFKQKKNLKICFYFPSIQLAKHACLWTVKGPGHETDRGKILTNVLTTQEQLQLKIQLQDCRGLLSTGY